MTRTRWSLRYVVDVLLAVQERREIGVAVALRLVGDQGMCLRHAFESGSRVASLVSERRELCEGGFDLTFVSGDEACLDGGEVHVQRRPPDATLLGDR